MDQPALCSWRTALSNIGSEFAPRGPAGSELSHGLPTHWGKGTCDQLMCVIESGAHTGLILGASAHFISDTNVAVVTSVVIIKSTLIAVICIMVMTFK